MKVDTYVEYAQSFIEYSKSVGTLEPVPADRASTQKWSDKLMFTVSNEYGCLTATKFTDRVKSKPCKRYPNMVWAFDGGHIVSVLHGTCLMMTTTNLGHTLTHGECDESNPAFMYNLFDGTLFLEGDTSLVVGARYWGLGDHVKFFARDAAETGQSWKVDFV